jgi:hypothetical protein
MDLSSAAHTGRIPRRMLRCITPGPRIDDADAGDGSTFGPGAAVVDRPELFKPRDDNSEPLEQLGRQN